MQNHPSSSNEKLKELPSDLYLEIMFIHNHSSTFSGSDGLIKLWTIKSNECVKTLNEHEDKIWALAISKTEEKFISGGADSTLIEWKVIKDDHEGICAVWYNLPSTGMPNSNPCDGIFNPLLTAIKDSNKPYPGTLTLLAPGFLC